jgi:hypothetical protein
VDASRHAGEYAMTCEYPRYAVPGVLTNVDPDSTF